jgi:predicted RNA-binding Zn-ribbon protein involved in translation (DUF1610 family)
MRRATYSSSEWPARAASASASAVTSCGNEIVTVVMAVLSPPLYRRLGWTVRDWSPTDLYNHLTMDHPCPRCGVEMEAGAATAHGLLGAVMQPPAEPLLMFVIPGTPTSLNPVTAFRQGMSGEAGRARLPAPRYRCPRCAFVELYATEPTTTA